MAATTGAEGAGFSRESLGGRQMSGKTVAQWRGGWGSRGPGCPNSFALVVRSEGVLFTAVPSSVTMSPRASSGVGSAAQYSGSDPTNHFVSSSKMESAMANEEQKR